MRYDPEKGEDLPELQDEPEEPLVSEVDCRDSDSGGDSSGKLLFIGILGIA